MENNGMEGARTNPNAAAVDELIGGWRSATRLEASLREFLPPDSAIWAHVADISSSFSAAVAALDSERGSESRPDRTTRPTRNSWSCARRRAHPYQCTKVLSKTMDDGYTWRKYGQKEILNFKHPRSYFRCTHKHDKSCRATKQVQLCEEDPSMLELTYIGEHTCRDHRTVDAVDGSTAAATDNDHRTVPPFPSPIYSSEEGCFVRVLSSILSVPESPSSSTLPVLTDAAAFDPIVPTARLAGPASGILSGVQSSGGGSDVKFDDEILEFGDFLYFDDLFGLF